MALKVSRLQNKGQVTIPAEIRKRLGLEEGDLIAFEETKQGVVIRPQEVVDRERLEEMEQALKKKGAAFEEYFNFPQRVLGLPFPGEVDVTSEEGASIVDRTFGIFEPRKRPEDFEELRRLFIDELVENAVSEAPPSEE